MEAFSGIARSGSKKQRGMAPLNPNDKDIKLSLKIRLGGNDAGVAERSSSDGEIRGRVSALYLTVATERHEKYKYLD